MATSAFRSTTKRTPIFDKSSSGGSHRRSRSLSRFSLPDSGETPRRSGKFVNTVRGSEFPEISLDDLAIEFFSLSSERESERDERPSRRRMSEVSPRSAAAERRGRSVSRQRTRGSDGKVSVGPAGGSRRRSVSVVRCPISDSENERDHHRSSSKLANEKSFSSGNRQINSAAKPSASNHRWLERSLSQKDLPRMHDGYFSHSSALTDDESRDGCSGKSMTEKTIRAVYAQKKPDHPTGDDINGGLYEAMKKELRHAVDEIKTELEHATVRKSSSSKSSNSLQSGKSNVMQPAATPRKHHATLSGKLDKRKDDLLAEFLLEEQRRRDPSSAGKPSRTRKSSKDKTRISSRLAEEAEKYFEDFFSNFEDTDVSSFDGERSDTSSTFFGSSRAREPIAYSGESETFQSPAVAPKSDTVEMEGVILPWLEWETSNDGTDHPLKNKREIPATPKSILQDLAEEIVSAPDLSFHSTSSSGSWNPEISSNTLKRNENTTIDMEKYIELQKDEELLLDTWRERHRINSGGLLLCSSSFM